MDFHWIAIPSGRFTMGTTEEEVAQLARVYKLDHFLLETPQRQVYLDAFEISKYPVTNAQYKEFVEMTGCSRPMSPYFAQYVSGDETLADHPIAWISWYDAMKFCQWARCRLPTEAEWEKAARGPDGFRYPWGNEWRENHCNSYEGGVKMTTPVKQYPQGASPYGVCDMAGNVWEWTNGWLTTNTISPKFVGWKGEMEERLDCFYHLPVLRGGATSSKQVGVRCSFRFVKYRPQQRGDWVGFRCVRLDR